MYFYIVFQFSITTLIFKTQKYCLPISRCQLLCKWQTQTQYRNECTNLFILTGHNVGNAQIGEDDGTHTQKLGTWREAFSLDLIYMIIGMSWTWEEHVHKNYTKMRISQINNWNLIHSRKDLSQKFLWLVKIVKVVNWNSLWVWIFISILMKIHLMLGQAYTLK